MPLNEIPKYLNSEIRSLIEAALEDAWQELNKDGKLLSSAARLIHACSWSRARSIAVHCRLGTLRGRALLGRAGRSICSARMYKSQRNSW